MAATAGAAHSQTAASLDTLRTLVRQARFAEVQSRARDLLTEAEAAGGPDSVRVADVADVLVESLWRGGKARAPETRALAERALAIREQRLGAQHPDVGYSLTTLGIVVRLLGDYPGAASLFARALAIEEQALGPDHPQVARTLTVTALLKTDTGDLSGAESMNKRALSIREQALPPGDAARADNLNGLGVVLERRGDTSGAERYHQQALAIREQALGPAHPDVAASLNGLANIRIGSGDYAAARSMHERALTIREKALGPEHPDVAMSLNNLAIAVRDLGDHAGAWWLLERVFAIWEQVFGPKHPNVASVTHNLATILVDLGDGPGDRLLAERARRVRAGGTEGRDLSESLNRLVGIDPPSGSYHAAQTLLEHALELKEQALGPSHQSVAMTLTSLASVLSKSGQAGRARPILERALAIREKSLGPTHLDVADTLDRLGELLAETGDHASAVPVFERVLALLEQGYGTDHPHAGIARQHLAESLVALGDAPRALSMALEAERIGRDHLRLIGRSLPEREALLYAAVERPVGLDVVLTLAAQAADRRATASEVAWDAVARSRALVLDEMAFRHRTVGAVGQADVRQLAADLSLKREQLARIVVRGPGASGPEYRLELERARNARDAAERAVAERSLEFRQEQLQRQFGFAEMRAALPPASAIIAFVRYARYPFGVPAGARIAPSSPVPSYLAFVLRAGEPGEPAVVPLGPAQALDDLIATWRKQVTSVAMSGGRSTTRAEAVLRPTGVELRTRIWDALAPHVGPASLVFIVPDGPLHLVNWEALPGDGAAYLIEQAPPLHYLSAERDLLPGDQTPPGRGLLVVDSPVFDEPPATTARVAVAKPGGASTATSRAESSVFRGTRSGCGDFRSMRFDALPDSAREADTIARIWRRTSDSSPSADGATSLLRLSGRAATEAAVKARAAGTRVLHLATHGFFLGSRCMPAADRAAHARDDEPIGANAAENPLLLAGFALSGANSREAAGEDDEDGILTAEEVAALDLSGVEWAVLSACDTGVGEVRAGEGVLGLRRAFQVAGARTVIMSLWPVEDEDTRRWMTGVYERRFVRGAGTMQAVRESSLEQLRRRRRNGLSTHPFYWAGFIATGEWR